MATLDSNATSCARISSPTSTRTAKRHLPNNGLPLRNRDGTAGTRPNSIGRPPVTWATRLHVRPPSGDIESTGRERRQAGPPDGRGGTRPIQDALYRRTWPRPDARPSHPPGLTGSARSLPRRVGPPEAPAAARADGRIGDQLLLLEHPAVLTLGRQADEPRTCSRPPASSRPAGSRSSASSAGGEVTYHGPGQLVAYPIIRLGGPRAPAPPVRARARGRDDRDVRRRWASSRPPRRAPGCWVDRDGRDAARKIGALGIRVERGVSYHGIALNVDVDLDDFDLIDPCGMPGLVSTSIAAEPGRHEEPPSTEAVAAPPPRSRPRSPPPSGRRRRRGHGRPDAERAALERPRRAGGLTHGPGSMGAGLFELRKDAITGWWVATIVDRTFDSRAVRPRRGPVYDRGDCQNCRLPEGTASGSGCSRTSRSTSSVPRTRPASSTARSPR